MINTLQERLITIRKRYSLPVAESEWICADVSRSSINAWENGKRLATIDALFTVACTYGVSLDWLCGLTETQYIEESVSAAENAVAEVTYDMLATFIDTSKLNPDCFNDDAVRNALNSYLDPKQRKIRWYLETRADIAVLIHYLLALGHIVQEKPILLTAKQNARVRDYRRMLAKMLVTGEPFLMKYDE